ncbi:MAG: pentapeptide repeat-containing protein [Bacteriovoracaceae bacterium]|nr:pentapeptide repeat-containing protein [Bacteriovoracaceae bacterium]
MNTLTKFFNPFWNDSYTNGQYEVIENEVLKASDLKGLTISGSLFSLTTFKNVTFESCVFFGSRMENCTFVDCKFINCDFQFTTAEHCNFEAVSFSNCKWDVSPIRKNIFEDCLFDDKTSYFAKKASNFNKLSSCMTHREAFRSQVGRRKEEITEKQEVTATQLPPIPSELEEALISTPMEGFKTAA